MSRVCLRVWRALCVFLACLPADCAAGPLVLALWIARAWQ